MKKLCLIIGLLFASMGAVMAQESKWSPLFASYGEPMPQESVWSHYSLRANLLRWATATPSLGFECKNGEKWSSLVDVAWAHWKWDGKNRHYGLWEVSYEVRRYLFAQNRAYVGAQAKVGQFNYKLSDTGKQGDILGGGLTFGYKLPLGSHFDLDMQLGGGYLYVIDLEKYGIEEGVRVKHAARNRGYWGITHAGVTLCYNL